MLRRRTLFCDKVGIGKPCVFGPMGAPIVLPYGARHPDMRPGSLSYHVGGDENPPHIPPPPAIRLKAPAAPSEITIIDDGNDESGAAAAPNRPKVETAHYRRINTRQRATAVGSTYLPVTPGRFSVPVQPTILSCADRTGHVPAQTGFLALSGAVG
jgi:hypothetical protein